jgi:mannose-6-phosphate isomerase-like protein (cupin superfamily)
MFTKKSESLGFEIPGGTKGRLYPAHPKGEQSMAVVEMDGIYPEKGWSLNDVCTETIYLEEGSFTITVDDQAHTLEPGDQLMIFPGTKYQIKGKGRAAVLISPSWDSAQNHIIED